MSDEPESLDVVIDRRVRDLLAMATEPKDLSAALDRAIKWHEAKGGGGDTPKAPGSAFKGDD